MHAQSHAYKTSRLCLCSVVCFPTKFSTNSHIKLLFQNLSFLFRCLRPHESIVGIPTMAFNKNLFKFTLIFYSFLLLLSLVVFSPIKSARQSLFRTARLRQPPLAAARENVSWFDVIVGEIKGRQIKIGLVNIDDHESALYSHHPRGLAEFVNVRYDPVSKDMKWEEFFPEWVDEKARWGLQKCPEIPMPRLEDYQDLDVVAARVPCGRGSRDLFRLQVNTIGFFQSKLF